MNTVKGYKVFNPDWTCIGKKYTCPGKFEEAVTPILCERGMHFCKKAADCFQYYSFAPNNHVAEVIAYGEVVEYDDKCVTNKLEIVREIPWGELLDIVNTGAGCTGYGNTGNDNSGDRNSGNGNTGNDNSGNGNSGNGNTGNDNSGNGNTGNDNSGDRNSGNDNTGSWNTGSWNTGSWNVGNWNTGWGNTGNYNSGSWNVGSWNKCDYSNGCFNTVAPKIYLFNKPSDWTYRDWLNSNAYYLLKQMSKVEVIGGYLKQVDDPEHAMHWWRGLDNDKKSIIKAIPNFDKEIFKEITGVDVDD